MALIPSKNTSLLAVQEDPGKLELKSQFIELRAKGRNYTRIAKDCNLGMPTNNPSFLSRMVRDQNYPRIQILAVEELLNGAQVNMPPTHGTFKKAERVKKEDAKQAELGL